MSARFWPEKSKNAKLGPEFLKNSNRNSNGVLRESHMLDSNKLTVWISTYFVKFITIISWSHLLFWSKFLLELHKYSWRIPMMYAKFWPEKSKNVKHWWVFQCFELFQSSFFFPETELPGSFEKSHEPNSTVWMLCQFFYNY